MAGLNIPSYGNTTTTLDNLNLSGLNNGINLDDLNSLDPFGYTPPTQDDVWGDIKTEEDFDNKYGANKDSNPEVYNSLKEQWQKYLGKSDEQKQAEDDSAKKEYETKLNDGLGTELYDNLNLYGDTQEEFWARQAAETQARNEGKNLKEIMEAGQAAVNDLKASNTGARTSTPDGTQSTSDNTGLSAGYVSTDTSNEAKASGEGYDYKGLEQAANTEFAESVQAAQTAAEKSAAASASAGINKSRAGMLSDTGTQTAQTNNVSNLTNTNIQQQGATQADYLNKMSQADALDQQAKFMKQGAGLQSLGAGIQGAASGAALGGTFGSDEDIKESPEDFDKKLADAIKQFRILYKKVKEKKACTKQ